MADIALGSVEKIVKLALAIKEAVVTVRRNRKECADIERCVARVSAIISWIKETTETMRHPAVSGPMEDLAESVEEALALVRDCQRKDPVRRFLGAGDMGKELRRVQEDIVRKLALGNLATNVQNTIMLTNIQHAGAPRPPPPPLPPRPAPEQVITGFRKFDYSELKAATNDFSDDNFAGRGGFAEVYKGVLPDGRVVAIKRLILPHYQHREKSNLYDEINIILQLKHKNIARRLGYCHEVIMRYVCKQGKYVGEPNVRFCFVDDFMPYGLRALLVEGSRRIDWSSRFRIIHGIAEGVQYLHEQRILHLDLKPANILLDSDLNPVIIDFGIARVLDPDQEEVTASESFSGTPGYMPPEYLGEGILSAKFDVYSFGVILLQIIRGMCRSETTAHQSFFEWIWQVREAWEAGRMQEWFDPSPAVCEDSQLSDIERCMELGMLCTEFHRRQRPTMADVLEMLNGNKELPAPKKSA